MKLSNRTYDILKKVSMMAVPLAAFVMLVAGAIARQASLEPGELIAIILTGIGTLLGKFLDISSKEYFADKEAVDDDNDAEDTQGVG